MSKEILVALDNSDYAEKVMLEAIKLAQAYGTKLFGVAVVDDSYFADDEFPYSDATYDYWKASFQKVLDKCHELAEKSDIYYIHKLVHGNPAEQIMKAAEEWNVDIIVLGHLGKNAAKGFAIGSVAQKVTAYAKCSVLVVK